MFLSRSGFVFAGFDRFRETGNIINHSVFFNIAAIESTTGIFCFDPVTVLVKFEFLEAEMCIRDRGVT